MVITEANDIILVDSVELLVNAARARELSITVLRSLRRHDDILRQGAPAMITYRGRPALLAESIRLYEFMSAQTTRSGDGCPLPSWA